MGWSIKFTRATAARWTLLNPVLDDGQPGFEKDTSKLKIGDGVTPWLTLPYVSGGTAPGEVTAANVSLVDTNDNFTADEVEGALAELFINVNNGKELVAESIVDKGGSASGSDTFTQLATAITNIPTGGSGGEGIMSKLIDYQKLVGGYFPTISYGTVVKL